MKPSRSLWAPLLLVLVGLAPRAAAQGAPAGGALPATPAPGAAAAAKPSDSDMAEAKRRSELGSKLLAQKLFEPAATELDAAYRLGRRGADLLKLAEAQRGTGAADLAYGSYEKAIATHMAELTRPQSLAARKAMQELEAQTGFLVVRGSADGAQVFVGARLVGTLPLPANTRVNAGNQRLRVLKAGSEPIDRDVSVLAGQTASVDVVLEPRVVTAHLSVKEAAGKEARVFVDGAEMGKAPWEGDIPPGEHLVELKGDSLRAEPQKVKIARRGTASVQIEAKITVGHLRIETEPARASIEVDEKETDKMGEWEGDLPPGPHKIAASAAGFLRATRTVTVEAATKSQEKLVLKPVPQEADPADDYKGAYMEVSLLGAMQLNDPPHPCDNAAPGGNCGTGTPLGGGLAIRGGHSFGVLGLEVIAAGLGTTRTDTVSYAQASPGSARPEATVIHDESYAYASAGGLLGAGLRLMTPGHVARGTIGMGGGVAVRYVRLDRKLNGGLTDSTNYSDTYVAPAAMVDLGVMFGSTPGFKVVLGVVGWAEFPSGTLASSPMTRAAVTSTGGTLAIPVSPYKVIDGMQLHIGPQLTIRFGH